MIVNFNNSASQKMILSDVNLNDLASFANRF